MTVELEVRGVRRTVEIRRAGAGWTAILDGRAFTVEVTASGPRWSMRVADPPVSGTAAEAPRLARIHDVAFEARGTSELVVHVDGSAVPVTVIDPRRARLRQSGGAGAAAAAGLRPVLAPMSGRVVKVLVGSGDPVVSRQPLVVVEAMKMENELRAPQAGTIREIRVSDGMPVEAGMVLVVIE